MLIRPLLAGNIKATYVMQIKTGILIVEGRVLVYGVVGY